MLFVSIGIFPTHESRCKALLYHFDRVFSHASRPKKMDRFKIRHKSKENFSAFSESKFSEIVNTRSKWYSIATKASIQIVDTGLREGILYDAAQSYAQSPAVIA
jgi:hypothetical protein